MGLFEFFSLIELDWSTLYPTIRAVRLGRQAYGMLRQSIIPDGGLTYGFSSPPDDPMSLLLSS